jgi:regulator of RNase E activity RraA
MIGPVEGTDWLATTLASDATDGEGVLPLWIRPLDPEMRVVGRASTATVARDDSLSFRQAAERGSEVGTVLVVGGAATSRRACMGDLVAKELVGNGFEAVVTDGLVRDSAGIRAAGMRVWSRGVCPIASKREGGGQVGGAVLMGDVLVREGDWVVADEDGVVIWPAAAYDELLAAARARLESDRERERALDERLAGRAR